MKTIHDYYLRMDFPESAKSPRDLLKEEASTELMGRLDGVIHLAVDLKLRAEYFAAVQKRIAETNVEVVEFPPADLEYLCTLVSGINGPGLAIHQQSRQIEFISSVQDHNIKDMAEEVIVPFVWAEDDLEGEGFNALTGLWEDWNIAIAFKIGGGPFALCGFYALYCRHADEENDEDDEDEPWKWRYGVHDEDWCSDVYGSVEEVLGFYAHYNEQTEENVRRKIRSWRALLGKQ